MVVMASSFVLFNLFYLLFCTGLVLQFRDFVSAGFSPENLLSWYVACSEEITPIEFHMRKSAATVVLHAALPLGYVLGYVFNFVMDEAPYANASEYWRVVTILQLMFAAATALVLGAVGWAHFWSMDNWSKHPFVYRLAPYASRGLWRPVAADINTEFRRIDKFTIQVTPLTKVVVTDNWLILFGQWPNQFELAHQSDISLTVVDSDQHHLSTEGHVGGAQFLRIKVNNRRPGTRSFIFRLNSLEYQNLQDKLRSPIDNAANVKIFKTVSERFVEVFREEVAANPTVETTVGLEPCIGCMVQTANVKLVRQCMSNEEEDRQPEGDRCVNCYCRPMWCLDCLARWFASRQNQRETETWLGSKCPCPTCRSKFCILDVAIIRNSERQ